MPAPAVSTSVTAIAVVATSGLLPRRRAAISPSSAAVFAVAAVASTSTSRSLLPRGGSSRRSSRSRTLLPGRRVSRATLPVELPWRGSTLRATLPWLQIGSTRRRSSRSGARSGSSSASFLPTDLSRGVSSCTTTNLVHQVLVLLVRSIARVARWQVAPVAAASTLGTVARKVTSISTDTADNTSREVLSIRAVVLAVTNLAAVLAGLVFVVTEGTVECGELAQLVALELVLAFGDRGSLGVNQYGLPHDETDRVNSPSQ